MLSSQGRSVHLFTRWPFCRCRACLYWRRRPGGTETQVCLTRRSLTKEKTVLKVFSNQRTVFRSRDLSWSITCTVFRSCDLYWPWPIRGQFSIRAQYIPVGTQPSSQPTWPPYLVVSIATWLEFSAWTLGMLSSGWKGSSSALIANVGTWTNNIF